MPKTIINYKNTILYKIVCKDLSIHDLYVGHTTDLIHVENIENVLSILTCILINNLYISIWFFIKAILINKIKYKNIPNIVTIYQDGGISVNKEFDKLRLAERETVFANLLPEYNGLINEYKKLRAFHLFWRNTICYKVYVKLLSIKNIFKKLS